MERKRPSILTGIIILGAVLTLIPPVLASEHAAGMVSNQPACEDGALMLVAEGSGDAGKGDDQSGGVQERAVPRPNLRILKPISIDPVTGTIMAQSLVTGKTVRIQVMPEAIARHKMTVGVPFDVGKMSPGANGNCKCGQYADGACYCVSNIEECCGPLHGCPMASCDKKQPIPGAGGKLRGF